jgi:hypothetical protein
MSALRPAARPETGRKTPNFISTFGKTLRYACWRRECYEEYFESHNTTAPNSLITLGDLFPSAAHLGLSEVLAKIFSSTAVDTFRARFV